LTAALPLIAAAAAAIYVLIQQCLIAAASSSSSIRYERCLPFKKFLMMTIKALTSVCEGEQGSVSFYNLLVYPYKISESNL